MVRLERDSGRAYSTRAAAGPAGRVMFPAWESLPETLGSGNFRKKSPFPLDYRRKATSIRVKACAALTG